MILPPSMVVGAVITAITGYFLVSHSHFFFKDSILSSHAPVSNVNFQADFNVHQDHDQDTSASVKESATIVNASENSIEDDLQFLYPAFNVTVVNTNTNPADIVPHESIMHINNLLGTFLRVDFPDLEYKTSLDIRRAYYPRIFNELPESGFLPQYKNPCWRQQDRVGVRKSSTLFSAVNDRQNPLHCLPYAYILGQPKSGTSDLFERLTGHHKIVEPSRKEVRWFTRGNTLLE